MKILVCLSNVPDTTTKITFTDNNTVFNSNGVQFIINPYDEIALARAVELTDNGQGEVTVIHVGEADSEATIRKALALGAHQAVRVDAKPTEAFFVATQIANYAKDKGFDLILTGKESIDHNGAQVASMLGELLQIPSVAIIKKLNIDGQTATLEREIEGGKEVLEIPLPVIAGTAEGVAEVKIANMRGIMSARTKPLDVIPPVAVEPMVSIQHFDLPPSRGTVKMLDSNDVKSLVDVLHQDIKVL